MHCSTPCDVMAESGKFHVAPSQPSQGSLGAPMAFTPTRANGGYATSRQWPVWDRAGGSSDTTKAQVKGLRRVDLPAPASGLLTEPDDLGHDLGGVGRHR